MPRSGMRTRRRLLSLLLAVTCFTSCVQTWPQQPEQQQQQHATIVLLHRRGARCSDDAANETISAAALQREQAAQWATEVINNQTRMLSIGIEVADTCGSAAWTEFRARQIVNQTQLTPIIGVIGLEEPQVLNDAAAVLRAHRVPLVVATPRASEALFYSNQSAGSQSMGPSNVFSAVPNSASIARATVAVAKGIHSPSIRILSTCSRTLEAARKAARQLRVPVISSEMWSSEHSSTISFIDRLNSGVHVAGLPPVVALLMEPAEMQKFMSEALTQRTARHVTWLIGCLGTIGPQVAAQWTMMLSNSAFLVEPHAPELAGLSQFLESRGLHHQPIENEVPHIVQAISALGAAFHLQELDNCYSSGDGSGNVTCTPLRLTDPSSLPADMLNALRKISLPKTEDASGMATDEMARELEGTSNHFTSSGRLVANRYLIQKLVAGTGESTPVAWYSDDDGLVLAIQSSERFYFFSSPGPSLAPVQPFLLLEEQEATVEEVMDAELKPTVGHSALPTDSAVLSNNLDTPEDSLDDISSLLVTSTPHHARSLLLQGRTWAAAIVALAATEFLAATYIMGLMILRLYQGVIQGSQGFDFLLLVSLIGQLMTVVFFVLPMSVTMHQLKLFLPPVLLVFSYTILLIKLMQSAGPVPQCHLYLILMLAVAVQTAVSCHFYSLQPQQELYTVPECSLTQFLLLYLFLVVLVALTTGYAIYLRHQSRSVLITSSLSTASVAIWLLCCTWFQSEMRDAATAVLVVVLSAVLLGANFIPKVAQMNQIQRQVQVKTSPPWQPPLAFNDKFASQLSGSALLRHPAYIGRHGI